MEYIVVIIASMLAGIGTGLVGLSAATAMVPLLIVLCPTFGGEHGAYMATAIALASDILGSAITSAVYAKNKKIDLRHGMIMLICIITMCTVGSVAAYFTHQQVLGGFSLFLCVAIGVRFLVSPSSKERPEGEGAKKLTAAQVAVSLFFGITIGFGTGFFGSGGGMMMLIVFTAMLGYDRKTAVGTSTFIMTFTALIASVSHILIEPTIIFECWDYLFIAIVTATVFSLISAQFANKVNSTVVGYTTGLILFFLGITLVLLNNREMLDMALMAESARLFAAYVAYVIVFAIILIIVRFTTKVPDYIFRKLLHVVAFTSIIPLAIGTQDVRAACITQGVFLVLVIIALRICESLPFYTKLFVEKSKHEVMVSFTSFFVLIAILLVIFWEHKYIAISAIMAWGPGDAAAAIVGKNIGKHKLSGKLIEGVKSLEGTIAMAITSFTFTLITLLLMSPLAWYTAVAFSLVTAVASALTELFTKRGFDTITCPIASALILSLTILI